MKESLQNSNKNIYLDVMRLLNIEKSISVKLRSSVNKTIQFTSLSLDFYFGLTKYAVLLSLSGPHVFSLGSQSTGKSKRMLSVRLVFY